MKYKHIIAHMKTAYNYAACSYAKRRKVGAIVVKNDRILSIGYNGTPEGWPNECEDELPDGTLVTKPEVLHAEMNCLMKLAKNSGDANNSTLFVTLSPCLQCAKGIYQAGISAVYYSEKYRQTDGIEFLEKCGIKVEQISIEDK